MSGASSTSPGAIALEVQRKIRCLLAEHRRPSAMGAITARRTVLRGRMPATWAGRGPDKAHALPKRKSHPATACTAARMSGPAWRRHKRALRSIFLSRLHGGSIRARRGDGIDRRTGKTQILNRLLGGSLKAPWGLGRKMGATTRLRKSHLATACSAAHPGPRGAPVRRWVQPRGCGNPILRPPARRLACASLPEVVHRPLKSRLVRLPRQEETFCLRQTIFGVKSGQRVFAIVSGAP